MSMKTKAIFHAIIGMALIGLAAGCSESGSDVPDKLVWTTDLPQALTKAKAEQKHVFMDFTGSDWCPACMAVHKKVFATDEFAAFAQTNLVLVQVDFPHNKPQTDELKKANQALQEKFNIQGYPTLILLDDAGKKLGQMDGYDGENPQQFIETLKKLEVKS